MVVGIASSATKPEFQPCLLLTEKTKLVIIPQSCRYGALPARPAERPRRTPRRCDWTAQERRPEVRTEPATLAGSYRLLHLAYILIGQFRKVMQYVSPPSANRSCRRPLSSVIGVWYSADGTPVPASDASRYLASSGSRSARSLRIPARLRTHRSAHPSGYPQRNTPAHPSAGIHV